MKRVYVDETIEKIIEKQTKKCEKVLANPANPSYDKAKKCLEELQALTDLIGMIKSFHNKPDYQCAMSQSDTNTKHYCVFDVSSTDELKKIFKKKEHAWKEPLDKNCHESDERLKWSDMGTYVKVIKSTSENTCYEEHVRKKMLEKMWENYEKTGKYAITPDQFEKLWEEMIYENYFGQATTYYVSIRSKL